MRLPDLVTPVSPPDGDNRELSKDDPTANGGSNFLAALHAEPDVTIVVADDDEGLEPGSLTGTGLLLDRHDLHDLVLESGSNQHVDDLVLLDWEGVEVDLLQAADFAVSHKTTELGHGDPLLLLVAPATSPAASATASVSTASVATTAEATAESTTVSATTFSHFGFVVRERREFTELLLLREMGYRSRVWGGIYI